MNINFFTLIIVTNPQCQITQQSRIDNCRQVKVSFIFIQNKNENDKIMAKLFHFVLACNLWKKRSELPGQDSATIDVILLTYL